MDEITLTRIAVYVHIYMCVCVCVFYIGFFYGEDIYALRNR